MSKKFNDVSASIRAKIAENRKEHELEEQRKVEFKPIYDIFGFAAKQLGSQYSANSAASAYFTFKDENPDFSNDELIELAILRVAKAQYIYDESLIDETIRLTQEYAKEILEPKAEVDESEEEASDADNLKDSQPDDYKPLLSLKERRVLIVIIVVVILALIFFF